MADGIGNAWHIPMNGEPPDQPSMRSPLTAIEEGTAVTLFNGNQFQGPGVTGDQTQSGSAVLVRKASDPTFTALPMKFHSAVENNKCHKDLGGARMTPGGCAQRGRMKPRWPQRPR